jgi:hypothetical protein
MGVSWRTVPMPSSVAALPRTRAGLPVPGAATWHGANGGSANTVAWSEELGSHLTCTCTPGVGKPVFKEQCPVRQRAYMTQGRCGLCTRDFADDEQLVFIGEAGTEYYLEPPMHPSCAAYALQVCPVLDAAMAGIETVLADTYTLVEDRITGVGPDGQPQHSKFPFADPAARDLGTLAFYVACPDAPRRIRGTAWLSGLRTGACSSGGRGPARG